MKNIIVGYFIILAMVACDPDFTITPDKPKPDLAGAWKFEGDNISGEFKIVRQDSIYAVKEGQYTTDRYTDFVQYETPVVFEKDTTKIVQITLLNTQEQENFVLHKGEINDAYTEIRFTSYSFMQYGKDSGLISGPLILRRGN